jgi:hypothetical protein
MRTLPVGQSTMKVEADAIAGNAIEESSSIMLLRVSFMFLHRVSQCLQQRSDALMLGAMQTNGIVPGVVENPKMKAAQG